MAMERWRCIICGYIHDGDEPPLICPVCGAPRELFEEITISEEQP
jgi:rubrerythrin